MQSVVFAWLVTIVLAEPAEYVGLAQTAILAPGMALILLAGALADRLGADRQALCAQLVAALIPWVLIAALQFGFLSYSVMVIYALLMGTAQAFVTPSRDGLLNHVAEENVQQTVLMTSLGQFTFQILGYWLAGYADRLGASTILMMQSFVLLVGVSAFELIRRQHIVVRQPKVRSVLSEVITGARTVAGSSVMRPVVIQNVAMGLFFMGCFIVCFPLMVRDVFNGSSGDMATLYAINSFGLVATILIMLRVGYVLKPGRALLIFQMLGAAVLAASGLMESFWLFCAAVFVWGLCGGIAMPMSRTVMQELAPAEQRSRVMSFYAFSFFGAGPLGTLFNGYLSGAVGPRMAIVICGLAMFSVGLIMSFTSKLWSAEMHHEEVA